MHVRFGGGAEETGGRKAARRFRPTQPYIPTWSGVLFLAAVMDVFRRRIVGWAMVNHLRTELVLDALNMAL